ncbi:hTAFII28-like protein conserved region-domain-containing protein [Lobosporangium transversale]|uniref:Transcription initiation factor TFIID subunit 11 n=1 Tax=Lobosporangium transversale TaxID=64571 RepID=A0A1Y2GUB2_9FUNG|nr:hTAFII28-like protein conserved region-domain-containing protein [Lobosporangium transversale]ORZ21929.1 hTAFII28-like protein conserved region-domain-containing protein [Lobosporangium transversale]|eukprot:XP_021883180.1 hTAFII28-like protein conserved region-domain-containing protein [Lobosporangium transversale]
MTSGSSSTSSAAPSPTAFPGPSAASTPTPSTPTTVAGVTAPAPRKRKNAAVMPSLPKPKKQKLHRNLDNIVARKQLPDVPTGANAGGNKTGQRMVKGPYKKREKKADNKDGKKGAGGDTAPSTPGGGIGASSSKKGKGGKGNMGNTASAAGSIASGMAASTAAAHSLGGIGGVDADGTNGFGQGGYQLGIKNEDDDETESRAGPSQAIDGDGNPITGEAGGDAGGEGKEDEDDEHEEEPEYTDYEWSQEANARGRSKEELKALLDCFSEEQLQRYEVYRRSVLSKSTIKKLVGTILNQQVTQTMAFVVAGFCKVFVGEMVEKAREVMEDWGETGPIRPEHLREAQRRHKKKELQRGQGVRTPYGYKRRMFCR